jgi:hypothetical protein
MVNLRWAAEDEALRTGCSLGWSCREGPGRDESCGAGDSGRVGSNVKEIFARKAASLFELERSCLVRVVDVGQGRGNLNHGIAGAIYAKPDL